MVGVNLISPDPAIDENVEGVNPQLGDVQLHSFLQPLNVGLQKLEDVEDYGEEDHGKDVDKQALLLETRLVERCWDWNPEREK